MPSRLLLVPAEHVSLPPRRRRAVGAEAERDQISARLYCGLLPSRVASSITMAVPDNVAAPGAARIKARQACTVTVSKIDPATNFRCYAATQLADRLNTGSSNVTGHVNAVRSAALVMRWLVKEPASRCLCQKILLAVGERKPQSSGRMHCPHSQVTFGIAPTASTVLRRRCQNNACLRVLAAIRADGVVVDTAGSSGRRFRRIP